MASLLPTPEPPDPVEGALGHFDHSNWVKQALKNLDAGTVRKSGDVITGDVTIDNASSEDANLRLAGTGVRSLWGETSSGLSRWRLTLGDSIADSTGDSGAKFGLFAYSNSGALKYTVLEGDRVNGLLTVAANPTAPLGVATKQYVDAALPLGAIIAYGGSSLSTEMQQSWMICDGSAHNSGPLGTLLGSPNVPDLRGLFVVGAGAVNSDPTTGAVSAYAVGKGTKSGKEKVLLSSTESGVAAHPHTASVSAHTHNVPGQTVGSGGMSANNPHYHGAPAGFDFALSPDAHGKSAASGSAVSGISSWQTTTNLTDIDHTHSVVIPAIASGAASPAQTVTVVAAAAAAAAAAHENRPPYYALVYIIKKI